MQKGEFSINCVLTSNSDSGDEMVDEVATSDIVREHNDNPETEEHDETSSEQSDNGEDDPIAARISERSQRLQERSAHVEDAIKAIANLHMAYRHGHADGLSVRDLELKRGQLRMEVSP